MALILLRLAYRALEECMRLHFPGRVEMLATFFSSARSDLSTQERALLLGRNPGRATGAPHEVLRRVLRTFLLQTL